MTEANEPIEPIPGQTTIEDQIRDVENGKRMKAQNKAYGTAMKRLRELHREDFEKLVDEEYAKVGVTFRRRATAEERAERERLDRLEAARKQMQKLLADNPDLAAEIKAQEEEPAPT